MCIIEPTPTNKGVKLNQNKGEINVRDTSNKARV
jgi:hypothetical protein